MIKFEDLAQLTVEAMQEVKDEVAVIKKVSSALSDAKRHGISFVEQTSREEDDRWKRWARAKAHIAEMLNNNLFHGLIYICDSRFTFRRIIWLFITVTALGACVMKVKELTHTYLRYPFKTIKTKRYLEESPFPAISICNINDMRMSVMRGTLLDEAIRLQDPYLLLAYDPNESWKLIKTSSHEIKDMILSCKFNGKTCSHENFTTFYWKQGERCYTFNDASHGRLTVKNAGLKNSLDLVINIQHYDYYRDRSKAGIHLIVHDQHETPVRLEGSRIPPGFCTHVKLRGKKYINLPAPYATNCGEKNLKFFDKYSRNLCWLDSLTTTVNNTCKCKDYFMPGADIPVCDIARLMNCTWPHWEKHDLEKAFDCPLPCEVDTFNHKLSSSKYPSEAHAQYIMDKFPVLKEAYKSSTGETRDEQGFLRDTLMKLVIYYDELSYDVIEQKPSYETLNWIGDVGGTVALFAGMGAMSFVEILDCIVMVVYRLLIEKNL